MAANTTFNPPNNSLFTKAALNYDGIGVSSTATAGTTTNIDHILTDDALITGAQVLANIPVFGDSMSFQVVDVNNILGYGANTVLNQFVTNWQTQSDSQEQINLNVSYPAKIIAGLCLRLIYKSTGLLNVNVAINYSLHKVLL